MISCMAPVRGFGTRSVYRRIVARDNFEGASDVCLVNWPQNDYFDKPLIDVPEMEEAMAYDDAEALSLSLLYWMQTEAPRPDGIHSSPASSGSNSCGNRPAAAAWAMDSISWGQVRKR